MMALRGGYRFSSFDGAAKPVLTDLDIPRRAVIDLSHPLLEQYRPAVEHGDVVRAGETILTRSRGGSHAALPAPVNGTVEIGDTTLAVNGGGSPEIVPVAGHIREPWLLDHAALFEMFCATGANLLFGDRFATGPECDQVHTIIVNALHTSPLVRNWHPGLYGDGGMAINGFKALQALFPKALIVIASARQSQSALSAPEFRALSRVKVLSDKYPQEHPALLIRDVLDRPLDPDAPGSDRTVLVAGYTDVVQLAEVMTTGRPLVDRIVSIAGPGISRPGWYRVRIGTSLADIRGHAGKSEEFGPWRYISGTPLDGEGITDFDRPVFYDDRAFAAISEHAVRDLFKFLAPGFAADSYSRTTVSSILPLVPRTMETSMHGGLRPCIQCNYCDEVCPVGIYPFLIWKFVQTGNIEETFRLRPDACIGCGLCDYVCPSRIGISDGVKTAREALRAARSEHAVSD